MRIAYFGVFERPYDTEVYIAKTLESLGHQVDRYSATMVRNEHLAEIFASKPDFVLLSKGWYTGDSLFFKKAIKDSGLLTVGWFFDLVWGTGREWLIRAHPMFQADIVFTTDGGHEKEFKEAGINHHVLRQGIFEPEAYMAQPETKREDIIFVGTSVHDFHFRWKYRQELIEYLKVTYPEQFHWYGSGDGVRNAMLNQLFADTKVVVGDSVYHPYYWSNRLYETLGRGGFLLFPNVPGIEKEFTPYKHFIPYTTGDWAGLKEKIDYYVTHDKEREEIRKAGFEHCKANHTYTTRCKELLKKVEEFKRENNR